MGLHGAIRVGNESIGGWSAIRTHSDVSPGVHRYKIETTLHGKVVKGTTEHRYSDGAAALAIKAISLMPKGL